MPLPLKTSDHGAYVQICASCGGWQSFVTSGGDQASLASTCSAWESAGNEVRFEPLYSRGADACECREETAIPTAASFPVRMRPRRYFVGAETAEETAVESEEIPLTGKRSCSVTAGADEDENEETFIGEDDDDTRWIGPFPFPKGRAAWDRMALAILLTALLCLISACDKTP